MTIRWKVTEEYFRGTNFVSEYFENEVLDSFSTLLFEGLRKEEGVIRFRETMRSRLLTCGFIRFLLRLSTYSFCLSARTLSCGSLELITSGNWIMI